jgi:hypothetical protein
VKPSLQQYRLFTGKQGDTSYWHWVALDPIKLTLVSTRIKQGSLDVAEYGEIIQSGWGDNPPTLEEMMTTQKLYKELALNSAWEE